MKIEMPFFSIIIPVYNVAPYLRNCLDSVLAQTFTDWEAICIDDGSTDGSGVVLDEYAAQDRRFRVVHQPNQGVGPTRNAALRIASGVWIGFLDADDVYREGLLEKAFGALAYYPDADVIRFKLVEYDEGEMPSWRDDTCSLKKNDMSSFIPRDAFIGNFPERFYRGDKFKRIPFPPLKRGEDRVWLAKTIMSTDIMLDIDYVGYGYLQRHGSAIHQGFTCEMLQSHLAWQAYALNVFTTGTEKIVDAALKRYSVLGLTEDFSRVFFCEADSKGRNLVWNKWLDAMNAIKTKPYVRKWNRLAMTLVCRSRSKVVAWVLFYLPNWLKLHGVHR